MHDRQNINEVQNLAMHAILQEKEAMETTLGKVRDIPVVKKVDSSYILKNGCMIEDTFAETCRLIVVTHSVLG